MSANLSLIPKRVFLDHEKMKACAHFYRRNAEDLSHVIPQVSHYYSIHVRATVRVCPIEP